MRPLFAVAVAVVLMQGVIEEQASAGYAENGLSFNGLSFNGLSFNGLSFNGLSFNGLSFNGLSFNGLSFNGGLLTGTVAGASVDAFDMIGAVLRGYTTDGDPIALRIDDVAQSQVHADVYHYWVSFERRDGRWQSICPDGGAALAIPGEWMDCQGTGCGGRGNDPDAFTFACQGSSIAKCAEDLGYRPWLELPSCTATSKQSGAACLQWSPADYHEACVRMLRGDYCGNGMPTTQDGTQINVWDEAQPPFQVADESVDWPLEAEWNPQGATCVSHVRWDTPMDDEVSFRYGLPPGSTVADYVEQVCEPNATYAQQVRECGEVGSRSGIGLEMLLANDSEILMFPVTDANTL